MGFVVGFGLAASGAQKLVPFAAVMMIPVGFLVQSAIISNRQGLPFGRACLVSLAMIAISIVVALIIAAVIVGIMIVAGVGRFG